MTGRIISQWPKMRNSMPFIRRKCLRLNFSSVQRFEEPKLKILRKLSDLQFGEIRTVRI